MGRQDTLRLLMAQHTTTNPFSQSKLTRREWEGLEVPLPPEELAIMKMIVAGWSNPEICTNPRQSLLSVTKLGSLSSAHDILYDRYLRTRVEALAKEADVPPPTINKSKRQGKKEGGVRLTAADSIRLANTNADVLDTRADIWEAMLLMFVNNMIHNWSDAVGYYTLARALEAQVDGTNPYVLGFVKTVLEKCKNKVKVETMVEKIEEASELNPVLQTFANRRLYRHQKDLFAALKSEGSKLIMYQAPTGTGKTLSPLAVSEGYKVIFVCASKHVGMQLARACISLEKRIAVAFGCHDAGDIRLHYYAVSECTRRRRTGAIGKIDHSQGQKADIMITDAISYLSAMHYMLSFNTADKLLVYWDEPTIAMDKPKDDLHEIVRKSWAENQIPNIVLSSATLPPPSDLPRFIEYIQNRFSIPNNRIITINNYECARTVPILLKSGHVAMPHVVAETKEELVKMAQQCSSRATLLRHIDLGVAARYVLAACKSGGSVEIAALPFATLDDVTPEAVKRAYLDLVVKVANKCGFETAQRLVSEPKRFGGGVKLATTDAASITHGPALYLAADTEKVAKYLMRDADPPAEIIDRLQQQAHNNSQVMAEIQRLEKDLEDRLSADGREGGGNDDDERMEERHGAVGKKLLKMREKLGELRLPEREVPNAEEHQRRYHGVVRSESFAGSVPPHHLEEVLHLEVPKWKKMLLMMGIGVFGDDCPTYRELMSRMASERELYCVIAGTDYVYGTNYQFCHGYIGKDLTNMPVEKLYQALGRVGRGRQAGQYSWRLRDDSLARHIFLPDTKFTEARRMDRLMSGN